MGGRDEQPSGPFFHTEIIIATATTKRDGLPIPLHCTWYNVTPKIVNGKKQDEFVPIESITGACFQPSVEDVGDRYLFNKLTILGYAFMLYQRVTLKNTKGCLCSLKSVH